MSLINKLLVAVVWCLIQAIIAFAAMGKHSHFGRKEQDEVWQNTEIDALHLTKREALFW